MRRAVLLALLLAATAVGSASASPPVVAVVGEDDGVNVMHSDFKVDGPVDYPAGMPTPKFVDLPTSGTFDERLAKLASGPLGNLPPGVLYAVRGTRLLFFNGSDTPKNVITPEKTSFGPRVHATGVVGAAIGARGTAPDALAVYVAGAHSEIASWRWIAAQPWIDVADLSGYTWETVKEDGPVGVPDITLPTCYAVQEARGAVAAGHAIFSSAGNTVTPDEQQHGPNGLPESYIVGSTDASGRAATPPYVDQFDPQDAYNSAFWATLMAWRFYDTGALAFFDITGPNGFDGTQKFGATSGAAPKTAGYALRLIAAARRILGNGRNGTSALATLGSGVTPPTRGPLSDGTFTVAELERVLHHTAIPHEQANPGRYAQEGFGDVNDASTATAIAVLEGTTAEPVRADEDAFHDKVEQARKANFDTRCGA
jgi:hypothetical protein